MQFIDETMHDIDFIIKEWNKSDTTISEKLITQLVDNIKTICNSITLLYKYTSSILQSHNSNIQNVLQNRDTIQSIQVVLQNTIKQTQLKDTLIDIKDTNEKVISLPTMFTVSKSDEEIVQKYINTYQVPTDTIMNTSDIIVPEDTYNNDINKIDNMPGKLNDGNIEIHKRIRKRYSQDIFNTLVDIATNDGVLNDEHINILLQSQCPMLIPQISTKNCIKTALQHNDINPIIEHENINILNTTNTNTIDKINSIKSDIIIEQDTIVPLTQIYNNPIEIKQDDINTISKIYEQEILQYKSNKLQKNFINNENEYDNKTTSNEEIQNKLNNTSTIVSVDGQQVPIVDNKLSKETIYEDDSITSYNSKSISNNNINSQSSPNDVITTDYQNEVNDIIKERLPIDYNELYTVSDTYKMKKSQSFDTRRYNEFEDDMKDSTQYDNKNCCSSENDLNVKKNHIEYNSDIQSSDEIIQNDDTDITRNKQIENTVTTTTINNNNNLQDINSTNFVSLFTSSLPTPVRKQAHANIQQNVLPSINKTNIKTNYITSDTNLKTTIRNKHLKDSPWKTPSKHINESPSRQKILSSYRKSEYSSGQTFNQASNNHPTTYLNTNDQIQLSGSSVINTRQTIPCQVTNGSIISTRSSTSTISSKATSVSKTSLFEETNNQSKSSGLPGKKITTFTNRKSTKPTQNDQLSSTTTTINDCRRKVR